MPRASTPAASAQARSRVSRRSSSPIPAPWVYAEALENVDDKQREGMKSVGASPAAVNRYGVVPQVLPVFVSQSLYFWESNIRSATVIGAVGAGGIGLKLLEAMGTNSDWDKVAYMVLLILLVVFLFDNLSNAIRSRLIGTGGH